MPIPDPGWSAAYAIVRTGRPQSLEDDGFTFTIGRGNDLCVAAVHA